MTRFKVVFSPLLVVALCLTFASAQDFSFNNHRGGGHVSGTVRGPDGSPVSGASVDLLRVSSSLAISSAVTGSNGTFALYNIPPGQYEVVAHGKGGDARELVSVGFLDSSVDLRFPAPPGSAAGNNSTVSVAQMRVPEKARDAFAKARRAFAGSKFEEAQKQIQKALTIDPQFAEALTLQGLLFLQKNDLAQSQKELESAIQIDANYSLAYLALGTVFNTAGRYEDAARNLERSISLSPDAWQGYFEMARAYLGQGNYAKALQSANRAQGLEPNHLAAIHLLKAYALIPQKLYADAAQELKAFLSRGPAGPSTERAQKLLAQVQAAELASQQHSQ